MVLECYALVLRARGMKVYARNWLHREDDIYENISFLAFRSVLFLIFIVVQQLPRLKEVIYVDIII